MNGTQVTVYSLRSISEQMPCVAKWRKMTSKMTTALQECRSRTQRSRGGYSQNEASRDRRWWRKPRHDSAGSLPTSFIKVKSPKGVHYFQYHEVIICFSNNTVGQKFKVFMFLDFTQQNNQKKLRWANTFVIILTESTLTVPCDNLKPNIK